MLGSIAAAGAWIRKSKEYFVELQSLREKKVHQERQTLMEMGVRLERFREKRVAQDIQRKAMKSDMEKLGRAYDQLSERVHRVKQLKDLMNEQEK
ncbi:hypothetical protein ACE6H2_008769 [Prunus campanulata]